MGGKLPVVRPKAAIKALQRAGFFVDHQRGSHIYLKHPNLLGVLVVVPYHATDLKRGTLKCILEQAGLSVEEFIKLLKG